MALLPATPGVPPVAVTEVLSSTLWDLGLLLIMWSNAIGADVMKRIAAPMVGGIVTSLLLELLEYPVIYYLWRQRTLAR
jgi:Cu/Ag efflux pump CusA